MCKVGWKVGGEAAVHGMGEGGGCIAFSHLDAAVRKVG